ncbi:hypothetical protein [Ethanoligenens harbinense]|uniref:Radical SAM protein n=1 Tax=Ethanoligenens harbinense (strain DSM 18485 / JCM 12961 / CGMCC 1.5033 / YUAN-3) TaxID=663278 RepID=E6U5V9_ETHHY|nr:hypothetical protein [Ethanoligenens harbinense]ADU27976.1 hypothetical protein Ethha_2482 [Ethanoligenens harbinense YUAN-3]
MKIGLWSDAHNFPNLVLMKLSAYHKVIGDQVEMLCHLNHYDRVYCSKTFDFTDSPETYAAIRADEILYGGTGYQNSKVTLPSEIEHIYPDYSLFPSYTQAYGFLTRGCPRACPFCVVSKKEGNKSMQVADLHEFWHGQKEIKLLDANLLACENHEQLLTQLAASGAWIDVTQGFDIRLVTPDNMPLINHLKIRSMHFAWDNPCEDLIDQFQYFITHTTMTKHQRPAVYVLTNFGSSHEQDLYRVYRLRKLGYDPYIMIYDKPHAPRETRLLQRWVNNKIIFRSTERFEEYNPKVG